MRTLEALTDFVNQHVALKGSCGVLAATGGFAVSLAQIEAWMRLASLAVGIAVGVATFISILRKNSK